MPRWLWFIMALGIGIAAGLYYGWVVSPVAYVDTTPESLSADYQTDYVLMVAEAFAGARDTPAAARQLATLGSRPPSMIVQQTLVYARANGYSPEEIRLLEELGFALQTWHPPLPGTLTP